MDKQNRSLFLTWVHKTLYGILSYSVSRNNTCQTRRTGNTSNGMKVSFYLILY